MKCRCTLSVLSIHCKKRLSIFPSPAAGMSQSKLSQAGNTDNLFLQCSYCHTYVCEGKNCSSDDELQNHGDEEQPRIVDKTNHRNFSHYEHVFPVGRIYARRKAPGKRKKGDVVIKQFPRKKMEVEGGGLRGAHPKTVFTA